MAEPYSSGCAAGGTDSEGDVGDAAVDGASCGGVADGGVGDALSVGVGDAEGVVRDAPVVSAVCDACSVCEGAAGGIMAACGAGDDNGVGVVGDSSGREFAHGWSWVWALATPGGGLGGRLWLVDSPVLVVLAASVFWACPRQSWRTVLMVVVVHVTVLLIPVTSAVAGVSPGYAEGEVGVGDDSVGGIIGDAAGEGGAGDGPADLVVWAVRVSCRALMLLVTLMVMLVSLVLRVLALLAAPMVRALLVMVWQLVPLMVLRQ